MVAVEESATYRMAGLLLNMIQPFLSEFAARSVVELSVSSTWESVAVDRPAPPRSSSFRAASTFRKSLSDGLLVRVLI